VKSGAQVEIKHPVEHGIIRFRHCLSAGESTH
jgi:hypothetical protein